MQLNLTLFNKPIGLEETIYITGNRQSGKTSLISRLHAELIARNEDALRENEVVVLSITRAVAAAENGNIPEKTISLVRETKIKNVVLFADFNMTIEEATSLSNLLLTLPQMVTCFISVDVGNETWNSFSGALKTSGRIIDTRLQYDGFNVSQQITVCG